MITCKYCGAQYGDDEKICPYCGSENVGVSIQEQQGYLDAINRKKQELNTVVPQQKAKRAVKKVHRIGLVLIGLFLIFAILAAGYSVIRTKQDRYRQQEALKILEEYYEKNDYEGMIEYLHSKDYLYSATYDKYDKLCEVYYYYSTGLEYLESDIDSIKKYGNNGVDWSESIEYDLSCFFRALYLLDELERNGYVYNEEEGVKYLRQLIMPVVHQNCKLTETEIQAAVARYEGYETEYFDLAEEVIRRVS